MQRDWFVQIVQQQYPLTDDVRHVISAATTDLYFGPLSVADRMNGGQPYPGFHAAFEQIRDAVENVTDLWVDRDSDAVSESEPEGEWIDGEWFEPGGESWHLERRDVLRALLGRELATYV